MSEYTSNLPLDPDKEQAHTLYKQKDYQQALQLYEAICQTPQATGWDWYFMASSLYNLKRYADARHACRRAWKAFSDPRPDALRNLSGWCIYQCDLKPLVPNDSEEIEEPESGHSENDQTDRIQKATKAAHSICEITSQCNGSPFARAVQTVSKILKRGSHWQQMEEWTARLDPAALSADPWMPTRPDSNGKTREIASELETWYGYRTKALLQMERHAECVDLCEHYERAGLKPHYDWDVWVPFYRAQSLRSLGRKQEAHAIMDAVIRKKRAASLLRVKALLLQDDGDSEQAWQVALDGALELREAKNDPKLILLLARLAGERGAADIARRHFELILCTWTSQDWKLPEALRVEIENAGAVLGEGATVAKADQLFRDLRRCWWKELEATEPRLTGVIESANGAAGFVRTIGGESLYFNPREFRRAAVGMEVDFWVRESWDHKKGRVSTCAIRVRETNRTRRPQ
jgi:tetratricopeptide (TPR) repeat protein